ncbi:MAG: hypothetical protein KIH69_019785 [Anaerolineae bacterium]|nr:hypothetical protein [Anaerolineae bacterium]
MHPEHKTSSPRVSARVIDNVRMTPHDAPVRVHHVAFSVTDAAFGFEVGDVLGVRPRNSAKAVRDVLSLTDFCQHDEVMTPQGTKTNLGDALWQHLEIGKLTAAHLKAVAAHTQSPDLIELLQPENKAALDDYVYGRELFDLLRSHPNAFPTPQALVNALSRLVGRLYVIANCPHTHPQEAHITVELTAYETHKRQRFGVCSRFLIEDAVAGAAGVGTEATVFVHKHKHFRVPSHPDTPMLMIGPGTGIAPFRAFLQTRAKQEAQGEHWLFCDAMHDVSHSPTSEPNLADCLYGAQLDEFRQGGWLSKVSVAPHNQIEIALLAQAAEIWQWLQGETVAYVCGKKTLTAQVAPTLCHIAQQHGGLNEAQAQRWLANLIEQKRYLVDVY